ncbi:MAG: YraN family protein [Gammaproteobacteria bacterium]|nr:YraN family protein [Gammaproteobacteria bacterium]
MDANRKRQTDHHRKLAPRTGPEAEREAQRYLEARGLEFVAANYRCRYGELDLVMREGACLVFVEVRMRRSARAGPPEATLTAPKKRRLARAAKCFIGENRRFGGMMLRFDVVGILASGPRAGTRWIRNALAFDGR